MTFDDFLNRYNNQKVEIFNRSAEYQCFDLAELWGDFLNLPRVVFQHTNACEIYTNTNDTILQYVDKIPNTPTAVPQKGDIIVWSAAYNGGPGHVGVCTGRADLNTLDVFEQNDPLASASHVKTYNYNYVLGWIRSKNLTNTTGRTPEDAQYIKQLEDAVNAKDVQIRTLNDALSGIKIQLADKTNECLSIKANIIAQIKNYIGTL